jgi:hypothetical protein
VTVRVTICHELFAEASHVLPHGWNGFAVPVFTAEQADFVINECFRLGWMDSFQEEGRSIEDEWQDLGNDEYVTSGWCWEVVG